MKKRAVCCVFLLALSVSAGAGAKSRPGSKPTCDESRVYPLTSPAEAYYATAKHGLRAFASPDGQAVATFGKLNVNNVPTVFGVLGTAVGQNCLPTWFRVQLPMRPNGVMGFVRASSVTLELVRTRLTVDLSEHLLTVWRNGHAILRTTAAVGSPATPTPTGRFYVNQRLLPLSANGPFGPGAIGISAFSDVLTGWVQGGPIAIHGTNQPWSIGHSASNGCVRVGNDVLLRLWTLVLPGTPVIIGE